MCASEYYQIQNIMFLTIALLQLDNIIAVFLYFSEIVVSVFCNDKQPKQKLSWKKIQCISSQLLLINPFVLLILLTLYDHYYSIIFRLLNAYLFPCSFPFGITSGTWKIARESEVVGTAQCEIMETSKGVYLWTYLGLG